MRLLADSIAHKPPNADVSKSLSSLNALSNMTIPVVCALIVRNGFVLCAQRSERMALPLKWEFPGGKLEPDELPEAALKRENTELLFVTLDKSDFKHNPTTMYLDYFISEQLFHWQSQNSTSPESPVGQSYIHQAERKKQILLFVREATSDEHGLRMAFVFCGSLHFVSNEGSKPMSITWRMSSPPPPELLNEGKKLAVG